MIHLRYDETHEFNGKIYTVAKGTKCSECAASSLHDDFCCEVGACIGLILTRSIVSPNGGDV